MGYILCRDAEAEHPYYVKELSINIYSAYELCYFIYHHSALLGDDFPDEQLLRFIGSGCRMPDLERKLRKGQAEGEDAETLMMTILQDVHYYGERELRQIQTHLSRRRLLSGSEKVKQKADYLLGKRRFQAALNLYEKILKGEFGEVDDGLRGRIRYNSGIALAGLFMFRDAAEALTEAYDLLGQENILRDLRFIYELDDTVPVRSDLLDQVQPRVHMRWIEEIAQAKERAAGDTRVLKAREALEKGAFSRREAVAALTDEWKTEYRGMFR